MTTTTGARFRFTSEGATRPTLLEIFATWCPHCGRMAPVLSKLAAKYGGRIQIVGVTGSGLAMDAASPENERDVVAWAKKNRVAYPVAYDASGTVVRKYPGRTFPTIVLIGSDGTIESVGAGEIPFVALDRRIDAALVDQRPDP